MQPRRSRNGRKSVCTQRGPSDGVGAMRPVVMGEGVVVAHAAVERTGLGRETDRTAIGGTDGKGTAIRKGEGKGRKGFRREEVTEGAEARSTHM